MSDDAKPPRRSWKCKIAGSLVKPCTALSECVVDDAVPSGKMKPRLGVTFVNNLINRATGKRTRNFFMLACGRHRTRSEIL
jgi:hypothetical protein